MQGVEPLSDEGVVEHYVEKREGSTTQQIRVSEASQQERGHPFGLGQGHLLPVGDGRPVGLAAGRVFELGPGLLQ